MLNDFRNILNEAIEYKISTNEEVLAVLNNNFKYCKAEVKSENSSTLYINVTVDKTNDNNGKYAKYIFGSSKTRYPMGIIDAYLDKSTKIGESEPLILSYGNYKYNAIKTGKTVQLKYFTKPVYITKFNINNRVISIVTEKKLVIRGHGEANTIRANNVPYQECAQALSVMQYGILAKEQVDLSMLDNRFHFSIYDNIETRKYLIDMYNNNKDLFDKTGRSSARIAGIKNMTEMTDMTSNKSIYSHYGLGAVIRKKFNECNKKEEIPYKNINSWFPADMLAYKNDILPLIDNANTLNDLTLIINKNYGKSIIPLSLKLNLSNDRKNSKYETNKSIDITPIKVFTTVMTGEIIVHYVFKHNKNQEEVNMIFKCFGNDDRVSMEHSYKKWNHDTKRIKWHYAEPEGSEIELSKVINKNVNETSMLGKAWNSLYVFMNKLDKNILKPENIMNMHRAKNTYLKPVYLSEKDKDYIKRPPIVELYENWLTMADYAITSGLCKDIYEFLTYTLCAGIKTNYGQMQCYPYVAKIS